MKRRRARTLRRLLRLRDGFILLEVIAAVALVGILVVPLFTAFAGVVERSRLARQAAGAQSAAWAPATAAAWEWGPRVAGAWWGPGPVLHVSTAPGACSSTSEATLGIWADGLLLLETPVLDASAEPDLPGETRIEPWKWTGLEGDEVIARVRTGDGIWGPPRRSVVPAPTGGPPAANVSAGLPSFSPAVVVHRPQAGTSAMHVSWGSEPVMAHPPGLVFTADPPVSGWAGAALGGQWQWWWMEEGRGVDLYF